MHIVNVLTWLVQSKNLILFLQILLTANSSGLHLLLIALKHNCFSFLFSFSFWSQICPGWIREKGKASIFRHWRNKLKFGQKCQMCVSIWISFLPYLAWFIKIWTQYKPWKKNHLHKPSGELVRVWLFNFLTIQTPLRIFQSFAASLNYLYWAVPAETEQAPFWSSEAKENIPFHFRTAAKGCLKKNNRH